jgi:hypothetical protein
MFFKILRTKSKISVFTALTNTSHKRVFLLLAPSSKIGDYGHFVFVHSSPLFPLFDTRKCSNVISSTPSQPSSTLYYPYIHVVRTIGIRSIAVTTTMRTNVAKRSVRCIILFSVHTFILLHSVVIIVNTVTDNL